MPDLMLFVAPNTCARVPTIGLEEAGVPFDTHLVRVAKKEQKSPEFLKLNPKGKVPTLLIDGEPLTENVAILTYLARTFPEAGLLPAVEGLDALKQTADLAFFAGTVHPTVTRVAMPLKFIADKELSYEIVKPVGIEAMDELMTMINDRLADGPWWYGDTWSIVDAYLFWVFDRIIGVGYDGAAVPHVQAHHAASLERPAVQRAMAREAANIEILKAEGAYMAPR